MKRENLRKLDLATVQEVHRRLHLHLLALEREIIKAQGGTPRRNKRGGIVEAVKTPA